MSSTATPALAPVTKTMHTTFVGGPASGKTRSECWEARTTDGRFLIERVEITGTPWDVYEMADGKPVRRTGTFTTLRKARLAIAQGRCEAVQHLPWLPLPWVTVEDGAITGRFATQTEAREAASA